MPQVAAVIPGASRASRIAENSDALKEVAPAKLVGMI
jgi:aryl-alcohol dehydrogenase-like predicted oxidoreductase